jgi:hypothetical protein
MLHLAFVIALVVPQETAPEKVFEAFAAELRKMATIHDTPEAVEKLGDFLRTPERKTALARKKAFHRSQTEAFLPATSSFEVVSRSEEQGRVILEIRQIDVYRYADRDTGKPAERTEKRPARAVFVKEAGGWRLAAFERACGSCDGSGECTRCRGKGECEACQGKRSCGACAGAKLEAEDFGRISLGLVLFEKAPALSEKTGTAHDAARAWCDLLLAEAAGVSKAWHDQFAATLASLKAIVAADIVEAMSKGFEKEIEEGRQHGRDAFATVEAVDEKAGIATATIRTSLRGQGRKAGAVRLRLVKRGAQWLLDGEEAPCFACEGKGEGCAVCSGTGWGAEPYWPPTLAEVEGLGRECFERVEKETGVAWGGKRPVLKISTREQVVEILVVEIAPQMKLLAPGQNPKKAARALAEAMSPSLVGKYEPATDTMHILLANLEPLARLLKKRDVLEDRYLRTVLIHELVHASDERAYQAVTRYGKAKSEEELTVLTALVEGHAQYVTKRILAAEGREADFKLYESLILAGPPGMGEAEKVLAAIQTAAIAFAYVDGCAFFTGLEKEGNKTFVADVFAKPPAKARVIMHPEEFYKPREMPKPPELKELWGEIEKDHEDGYRGRVASVSEAQMRAAVGGMADGAEARRAFADMAWGGALVLGDKETGQTRVVIVQVLQTTDDAAAKRLAAFLQGVTRTKDEKMKDGAIRILKAEYAAMSTDSVKEASWGRKTMSYQGQEFPVSDVIGAVGPYVIEVLHSNVEVEEAGVKALVEKVGKALQGK